MFAVIRFAIGISVNAIGAIWAATTSDETALITAVCVGAAGVITAITGLIKVLRETRKTQAQVETLKTASKRHGVQIDNLETNGKETPTG